MCGPKDDMAGAVQDALAPEKSLATMLKSDLGLEVNPQALRMFVRARWSRVSKLAHAIHESV